MGEGAAVVSARRSPVGRASLLPGVLFNQLIVCIVQLVQLLLAGVVVRGRLMLCEWQELGVYYEPIFLKTVQAQLWHVGQNDSASDLLLSRKPFFLNCRTIKVLGPPMFTVSKAF